MLLYVLTQLWGQINPSGFQSPLLVKYDIVFMWIKYFEFEFEFECGVLKTMYYDNKANLRDLIAATDLVILLKLDSNRQIFSPCDLEIW